MRIRVAFVKRAGKIVGDVNYNTETGNYSAVDKEKGGSLVGGAETIADNLKPNEELDVNMGIPVGSMIRVKGGLHLGKSGEVIGYSPTKNTDALVKFHGDEHQEAAYISVDFLEPVVAPEPGSTEEKGKI